MGRPQRFWGGRARPLLLASAAAAVLLAGAGSAPAVATEVTAVELPSLPGSEGSLMSGVTAAGVVVGESVVAGTPQATAWLHAGGQFVPIDLGAMAGAASSEAKAVNRLGLIAGTADGHAEVWRPAGGGRYQAIALADLPNGSQSFGQAVNTQGVVAGVAVNAALQGRAVIWRPDARGYGSPIDLGTLQPGGPNSGAQALNGQGVVVGESDNAVGQSQAVAWHLTQTGGFRIVALDPPPGSMFSMARGVDSAGVVAGFSNGASLQGIVWKPAGGGAYGPAIALPSLPGGTFTSAVGMSAAGVVAGSGNGTGFFSHAALWFPTRAGAYMALDLGTLPGGTLSDAVAVEGDFAVGHSDVGDFRSHPTLWKLGT